MLFLLDGYRSPGPWLVFPLIASCAGRIVDVDEERTSEEAELCRVGYET